MSIEIIPYKNFKDKIKITKRYKDYIIEDLGGIIMVSKNIILN